MKTKLKNNLAILLIMILMILNIESFASSSTKPANVTLNANVSSVKPMDTVVLDLKITNITLSSGVSTVTMNLNVDENIFNPVKKEDISNDATWTMTYNSTSKQLKLQTTEKIKEDKSLAKITLKAKSVFTNNDITSSQMTINATTIDLKNIKINNSRNLDPVSVRLSLGTTELPDPGQNSEVTPNQKPETPNVLPEGGLENPYIAGIIALVIIAAFSIYGYKKASGKIG